MGDDLADGLRASLVTTDAGQTPGPGPATIAVHDNGNVAGQLLRLKPEFLAGIERRLSHEIPGSEELEVAREA